MGEPTWRKRGCGTSLAAAVVVSLALWAAVLVPLILVPFPNCLGILAIEGAIVFGAVGGWLAARRW